MNLQQAVQPKSSANGFGHRRVEKEGGARLENKLQSGKSNPNRSSNAGAASVGKVGVYETPSRDRLVYLATCLIGHPVEIQLKNGSIYSGTCYAANIEKEFAIILKMARLTKVVPFWGEKAEAFSKAPLKTLIIPGKEVVQVMAKDVFVTMDGMFNELQDEKQQEVMLDSFISQSRYVEMKRELAPWVPDEDGLQCPELENIFDGPWNRGWDQFEANEMLFGVKSTFDEELYTTKLERGPQMREREKEAVRIAREIEGEETQDLHLAEERGINLHKNFDIDEETRFSSVYKGRGVDDSGYEEVKDILLDSCNGESFGDTFAASSGEPADWSLEKSSDGARVLSSSSLDEAQCSQSITGVDLYGSDSYDHSRQLAPELPSKNFPTSDNETSYRISENLHGEHGGNHRFREFVEEKTVAEDAQLPTFGDSLSSSHGNKDGSDKAELSRTALVHASASQVSSKPLEKSSSSELSEGAVCARETQSVNSRGLPGSSTSSNSDCAGAASTSIGPGLSPSSSVGSLSSEKSSLNPHAKEFKLNPNAKSFMPSQTTVWPPSPLSDSSLHFPTNVSALPQMHAMSMGIGVPSFTGHQPMIYNPQFVPLQTPQAYFHPGGPQYGQQMFLGPVVHMPSYQTEMPYKGREF